MITAAVLFEPRRDVPVAEWNAVLAKGGTETRFVDTTSSTVSKMEGFQRGLLKGRRTGAEIMLERDITGVPARLVAHARVRPVLLSLRFSSMLELAFVETVAWAFCIISAGQFWDMESDRWMETESLRKSAARLRWGARWLPGPTW